MRVDFLAKLFHSKAPNIQVIDFDKVIYTELESPKSNNLEEVLFDKACEELGIKESFDYAMSYTLDEQKALVFLTSSANLNKQSDFAFAEPLIWQNLSQMQTDIAPFYAVFVLKENYGFVAFFGNSKLLHLKNLPQFNASHLKNKDKAYKISFLNEKICEQSRVKELCRLYQSKIFVLDDELDLAHHLSSELKIPHLKTKIHPAKLQELLKKAQMQKHDEKANFLHHKADDSLLKRLLACFVLCFVLGFCVIVAEFFIKKHSLKSSFEIDKNIPNFSSLQKENAQNALIIRQKKEVLTFINEEFKPSILLDTLKPLFTLLHQKAIKLESLKLSDNEITLLIPSDEASAEFIKELYAHSFFTLKHKELKNSLYELILERK